MDIVWFGEDVPAIPKAISICQTADVLIIIGTSMQVYPAASLMNYVDSRTKIYYIDPNPAAIQNEQIVVIVRGRNTPYSLVKRHIQSLRSQTNQDFGIIWIDASSDDYSPPHIEYELDVHFGNRITYIWNEIPRPRCENILLAMEYISNQETIVILLDADDAFAGPEVISHVRDVFADGIEVAVGGMLRLDKHQSYPVDFQNPRTNRGGNVWQHLKCFRKRCIEVVPIEMFKLDNKFIHDEDDWALMLPIVEVSKNHHLFIRPMMIYTISENKLQRPHHLREKQIERIMNKTSLLNFSDRGEMI